ncbi:hypothetical protein OBBRIDRAFT_829253 [Obba rivulosa]|uniref:Uncharacterized protein n=1 Tax=Obba rivulosa TaxID=1052685 RepID=A0A8E2AQF6_9APHY|nr:hypothetical protein OBBRIDRAFT_829253 [Obba rivulosa]
MSCGANDEGERFSGLHRMGHEYKGPFQRYCDNAHPGAADLQKIEVPVMPAAPCSNREHIPLCSVTLLAGALLGTALVLEDGMGSCFLMRMLLYLCCWTECGFGVGVEPRFACGGVLPVLISQGLRFVTVPATASVPPVPDMLSATVRTEGPGYGRQ